ncbi:ABC transporter ATP-binding protein [Micromonospora sp. AMSO31t]|uniref:ABC transporter ATP-binding protein n=1 Tax=Micromonospora sp. AMSO31t TaxID=2650566 RepID=UPI001788E433|nr:ABC transporter ATP-binding protein [Micromonospora sp. AMSO31t]
MLGRLIRLLNRREARDLRALVAWLCAAAALQGVALALTAPFFIDLLAGRLDAALGWLIAVVAATGTFVAVQAAAQLRAFRAGIQTARALHHRMADHIARLPLGWFSPDRTGMLTALNTAGIPALASYPALLLRPLATAVVTPAAAALALLPVDWRASLAVAVCGASLAVVARAAGARTRRVDAQRHAAADRAAHGVIEFANAQQVLRANGAARRPHELDAALVGAYQVNRRAAGAMLPGIVGFSFALQIAFAAVLGLGVLLILRGGLDPGVFLGVTVVVARLAAIATTGAELGVALRMNAGTVDRIAQVLDTAPLPEPRPATSIPAVDAGRDLVAEFESVSFRYDSTPVLHDVSFQLPARGLTALVGPSGGGKTTVTRLLARFWDVSSGSVRVHGRDVRDIPTDELLRELAIVFQDVYLFDGTVEDNVRLGRPEASEAEVAAAMELAALTDLATDAGRAVRVGAGGALLSGGQKQRISIARAILKAAPITVLDEATAALDPENALVVQRAITTLADRGSVLVIAHQLRTVEAADTILVLDQGRIIDQGTHEQLRKRPGIYADFVRQREAAESWAFR